jgi:tRNA nucleotidyltransferase (CCA-adding enzyme)
MIDALTKLDHTETAIALALPADSVPSQIVKALQPCDRLSLFLVAARGNKALRRQIWHYLTQLSQVTPILTGHDLKRLGYKPGPQFKEILEALLYATLDRVLTSKSEAEHWLITYYQSSRKT